MIKTTTKSTIYVLLIGVDYLIAADSENVVAAEPHGDLVSLQGIFFNFRYRSMEL